MEIKDITIKELLYLVLGVLNGEWELSGSAPSDTTGWRQVFIDELTNRFGDTDIILKSMNIKLVICFDEHTDLFSVILKRGEVSPRNKILLRETVDGSNYKEVLGILDRIHSDFKHDFYDINGIAEQLKNFGY